MWPRQLRLPESPPADAGEELRRVEAAVDQLERAELYVVAALDLGLADPSRRLLEDLLTRMIATRRSLTRPRVLDGTAPPYTFRR